MTTSAGDGGAVAAELTGLDFLFTPAAFREPDRLVFPPPWVGHFPFAFWLADALRPRRFVELGTHTGNSYCAFLQGFAATGQTPACAAIDTWAGDEHAGRFDDAVFNDLAAYHDPRYGAFSTMLRMTFDEALGRFDDGSIDLLHIDGLHTFEQVLHDFETWRRKVSDRGVVMMHDTQVRERDFGVWKVWERVARLYPSLEFTHSNGLGVAYLGRAPMPPVLARLFAPENRDAIRGFFARLGEGLAERVMVPRYLDSIDKADAALAAERENVAERDGRLAALYAEVERLDRVVAEKGDMIAERDGRLAALYAEVDRMNGIADERARSINALEAEVRKLEIELSSTRFSLRIERGERAKLDARLAGMESSSSWRLTGPMRRLARDLRALRRKSGAAVHLLRKSAALSRRDPSVPLKAVRYLAANGPAAALRRLIQQIHIPPAVSGDPAVRRYDAWMGVNGFSFERVDALRAALAARQDRLPKISVVMPVYNTSRRLLDQAVASVVAQVYENWELCIADDASTNPETKEALRSWTQGHARIKLVTLETNENISGATNRAVELAGGAFVAMLDHDDVLAPDALAEMALAIADAPDVDLLYSDDDKIDMDNHRFAPQFKPDWAPTLLTSYMYLSHLLVVRRDLFRDLGGFRKGFEGSQDFDFALRAAERARRVVHVPKVLYHWRVTVGSTAASGDAKPESFEAGRRAVAEAFARRGHPVPVVQPPWAVQAKVGIFAPQFPDDGPRVAILIPTKNRVDLLRTCIDSLGQTSYRNYEIVVIDNDSDEAETLDYLAALPHKVLRISNPPGTGFNFARINNEAARQVDADYVLFLNNDTELKAPRWLSQMVGYAQMTGVGAVGARLLFPDGTIQHAGIIHGLLDGMAAPALRNLPAWNNGYLSYGVVAREYSAVTAACLLTPRGLFLELGGFDEATFAVAYNDVDYCYRLVDRGLRCVYCPDAELIHYEGKSRGHADNPREVRDFRRRYRDRVDPWYNPNLSREDGNFDIRPYHAPLPRTRPIRAVMVSHNLNLEGAPNSQYEMTLGLFRRGLIDPVVLSPADGPLRGLYEAAGIPIRVVRHPLADVHTEADFISRTEAFGAELAATGAEIVYANTLQTYWAIAAATAANLPSLWNPRESDPWESYFDFVPESFRDRAYGAFAFPYRVIFVAHATARAWANLETRFNYTVIPNGLDLARVETRIAEVDRDRARAELGLQADELLAVLVGTVCDRKGQIDLAAALAALDPDTLSRLKLLIVGDRPGAYSDGLHAAIARLDPARRARITVLGESEEVFRYYRAADIALCTSRIESYPRIILEAMACGLPLVTTPVFGIAEQVRENINGLFYQPGDGDGLARALARLVGDDGLRARLAGNSRPTLESLVGYDEMVDRYGALFREAAGSRGLPYSSQ